MFHVLGPNLGNRKAYEFLGRHYRSPSDRAQSEIESRTHSQVA